MGNLEGAFYNLIQAKMRNEQYTFEDWEQGNIPTEILSFGILYLMQTGIMSEDTVKEIHRYQKDCFFKAVDIDVSNQKYIIDSEISRINNISSFKRYIELKKKELTEKIDEKIELELLTGGYFRFKSKKCKEIIDIYQKIQAKKLVIWFGLDGGASWIETASARKIIEYLNEKSVDQIINKYHVYNWLRESDKDPERIWNEVLKKAKIPDGAGSNLYVSLMWTLKKQGYFKHGTTEADFLKIGGYMFNLDLEGYKTNSSKEGRNFLFDIPRFKDL